MLTDDGQRLSWRLIAAIASVGVVLVALTVGLAVLEPKVVDPLSERDGGTADGVSHVNPASTGEQGEFSDLERRLAERFADRLRSDGDRLGQDLGSSLRDRLGDERFERLQAEYRDIAVRTGNERHYELLSQASQAQQALGRNVSAYWELHQTYENLTADRNESDGTLRNESVSVSPERDPRRVARSLEERERAVRQSASNALVAYRNLTANSDRDYDDTVESIHSARRNVTDAQRAVRTEQFRTTTLSLDVDRATISPTRPLSTTGRIVAEDGLAPANRSVRLQVGPRNVTVETDETGRFSLSYRPTLLRANLTELPVRYRPENDSVYLGDTVSVPVDVQRVEPNVSVTAVPRGAAFNETLSVTGQVRAKNDGISGVPYVLTLDGRIVSANVTGPDGRLDVDFVLGAEYPPGAHRLALRLPARGRAVGNATASTTITVHAADANLSLEAQPGDDRTIRVAGRLETIEGASVGNRTVRFVVDGQLVGTTTTNYDGRFARSLLLPADVAEDGSTATVNATFDGAGTNLNPAAVTAEATVPSGGQGAPVPTWLLAGLGIVVVLAIIAGGLVRSRRWKRPADAPATPGQAEGPSGRSRPSVTATALLERANEQVADGRALAAIRTAYAALRLELGGRGELQRSRTAWEFYRTYGQDLDETAKGTLRRVTAGYQRVTFGGGSIDADDAADLIEAVRRLVERSRSQETV